MKLPTPEGDSDPLGQRRQRASKHQLKDREGPIQRPPVRPSLSLLAYGPCCRLPKPLRGRHTAREPSPQPMMSIPGCKRCSICQSST